MPYLNWRENPVQLSLEPHARLGCEFGLRVAAAELPELTEALASVFEDERPGRELRVDLPRNWLLFWKLRDSESRLLIAHPQEDEWVGTLALERGHASSLLERLRRATAGETIRVSELFTVGGVSNFELLIEAT